MLTSTECPICAQIIVEEGADIILCREHRLFLEFLTKHQNEETKEALMRLSLALTGDSLDDDD